LVQNYTDPTGTGGCVIVNDRHILDDKTLYSHLSNDWRQIFFRIPSIPDVVHLLGDPDLEEGNLPDDLYDEPEEEYQRPIHEAEKVERTLVYLLDEEAVRERVFEIMWLDVHGNCVWDFKICDICEFQGPLQSGLFLHEIVESYGFTGERKKWMRGTLLDPVRTTVDEEPALGELKI
jgi:hypothetical protein